MFPLTAVLATEDDAEEDLLNPEEEVFKSHYV